MQKIFNIEELRLNLSDSQPDIVIPEWILNNLMEMCKEKVEYCGLLFCYGKKDEYKVVEYPYVSGIGGAGSVFPKKKIIFDHPEVYSSIEFHTHTSALGEFWVNKFSDKDIATFNKRLFQEGEGYKHILFTPKNIITWGKNIAPEVRIGFGSVGTVMSTFNKFNEKYNCWEPAINIPID